MRRTAADRDKLVECVALPTPVGAYDHDGHHQASDAAQHVKSLGIDAELRVILDGCDHRKTAVTFS